ncbi:MAG TPA: hypothetical protein VM597_08775 [Gemmataceae bacterium]|nr:hypothetical protein [Gemmataceae bacterium]
MKRNRHPSSERVNATALTWRTYLVPKRGHSATECEDAIAGDPAAGRFAVADGASESYAAGEWARLLVESFVRDGGEGDWLIAPRVAWHDQVVGRAVSWYAEDKFASGGHATFLGLTVTGPRWTALAAGDANLFVVRDGALDTSFPVETSAGFTGSPPLVRSWGDEPMWEFGLGDLQPGDALLLATDALAQAILASHEAGEFIGPALLALGEPDAFTGWVEAARDGGQLRNDDVALAVLEYKP